MHRLRPGDAKPHGRSPTGSGHARGRLVRCESSTLDPYLMKKYRLTFLNLAIVTGPLGFGVTTGPFTTIARASFVLLLGALGISLFFDRDRIRPEL